MEKGIATSVSEDSHRARQLTDKEILTEVLGVMSRSMETDRPIQLDSVVCHPPFVFLILNVL